MTEPTDNTASGGAHLVVLYTFPENSGFWQQLEGRSCVLLSFVDSEIEDQFLTQCSARNIAVHSVVRAAQHMDAASLVARDKYSSFIATWPERFRKGGKNFKERFTHKGEISFWWLGSASAKQNEVYKGFDCLCHLEVVQKVLRQRQFEGCLLLSDDPIMAGLLRECCERDRLAFESLLPSRRVRQWSPSTLSALWRRLSLIGWFALELAFLKTILRATKRLWTSPLTAFLSLYPGPLEIRNGQVYDRMYRDVAERVAQDVSQHPVFLCWFQGRGLSSLRRLYADRHTLRGHQRILLLNSYLTFSDIWLAVRNLEFFARFSWLERFDRDFRKSFVYDGINIYQLLGPEVRRQFLVNEVPYHLIVGRAVERAVKAQPVQRLVSFLELYPFSRAVYSGAKRADPAVTTVAYQHANITKMRLWYTYRPEEVLPRGSDGMYVDTMPIPDWYMFQGPIGMEILKASGYPAERCLLTGSPRYDDLGDRVQKGLINGSISAEGFRTSGGEGMKRVVVTPAQPPADALELIEVTLKACRQRDDCCLLVKLHPDCHVEACIEVLQEKYGFAHIQVVQDSIHDLIEGADVVVTNYSTTGDEAIALGRPVICYTGLRPCVATYLDLAAAPVVHDTDEMGEAIERMLHDEEYRQSYWLRREELIEGSFYRLDGRAKDRMVEALIGNPPRTPGQ